MSNFLAVATVTAALQRLLQATVAADVSGAQVTADRPENSGNGAQGPTVNIFLYQVAPDQAMRNDDLPTRASNGQVMRRPQAALDLHYLLTFSGSDDELEPQRLLGSVVRTLHSQPLITAQTIAGVKTAATATPPTYPSLATTDLGDQVDRIKFTPLALTLEELSKLWSVFFQTPYALSVAYQASVVLIEEDVTPQPSLPVLERDLAVRQLRGPVIERVESESDPGGPIFASDTIALAGRHLLGDLTLVRIAGSDRQPVHATDPRVTFDLASLPGGTLRPGTQTVQVIQQLLLGAPPVPHVGEASNVATFVLHPLVTGAAVSGTAASGTITLQTDLTVRAGQQLSLVLLDQVTGARLDVIAAPSLASDGTTVPVPVSGLSPGTYLAQLVVDGAESRLDTDVNGNFTGPLVTLS
jgi:Pvc16 N-terminal domain